MDDETMALAELDVLLGMLAPLTDAQSAQLLATLKAYTVVGIKMQQHAS